MAKIGVDIDSTLYDFETPAREAFTKLAVETGDREYLRGAYDPWTEWRSPADACGFDPWMKAIALCHSADVINAQVPFDGAVATCQALIGEGHTLMYISNRAPESHEATESWLLEYGFIDPGQSDTSLVVTMGDKKPYLKHCQYLIDDRPKTVVDFIYDYEWERNLREGMYMAWNANSFPEVFREQLYGRPRNETTHDLWEEFCHKNYSRRAYVKAYPYNQNLTDIPHLYLAPTWAGLNSYMVSKGVLSTPAYHPLGASRA